MSDFRKFIDTDLTQTELRWHSAHIKGSDFPLIIIKHPDKMKDAFIQGIKGKEFRCPICDGSWVRRARWEIRSYCSTCGSGWFGEYVENNLCFDCALKHKRNPIIEKLIP